MNKHDAADVVNTPALPTATPVVILPPGAIEDPVQHGAQRVICMDAGGLRPALTWSPALVMRDSDTVLKVQATLVPTGGHGHEQAMVSAIPSPDLDIVPLLSERLCAIEGVVRPTVALLQSIQSPALRRLMSDVFSRNEVFWDYWQAPASLSHHHAYPGGLASHCLDMAIDLPIRLSPPERDLALVGCFLHDIGKVITYDEQGGLTDKAQVLGHELLSLDVLWQPLKTLEAQWPDTAYVLRQLVTGVWKLRRDRHQELMAVTTVINTLDRLSAERDRRRHARAGSTPWAPREWTDPCYDGKSEATSIADVPF